MLSKSAFSKFIKRAQNVHGMCYDYSKVEYVGMFVPVIIVCKAHGEFQQKPCNHVYKGYGCPKCGIEDRTTGLRKTHCLNGHLKTPSNTRKSGNCKECEWNKIGWTSEAFEFAMKEQNGRCSICDRVLTFDGSKSTACADHEHSVPPKPRGILCGQCNLGIGNLQDNPEVMRAAIAYVEKYK